MRSLNEFAVQIDTLLSDRCYDWPDNLPRDIQAHLIEFDQLCLLRLKHIIKLEIPEVEKTFRLRRFFVMRWVIVANTSLDYTLNPVLATNQLLCAIAKTIAQPEESVCAILMPTIEKIIGSDSPANIKYASED